MPLAHLLLHNQLRQQIQSCELCRGIGRTQVDGELKLCSCLSAALYTYRLATCNIPAKFRSLELSDYVYQDSTTYKKVTQYIQSLAKVVQSGHGLYLYGGPQSGRTLLASCVLKEAMRQGHSAYFITYGGLLSATQREHRDLLKDEILRKVLSPSVDFVCIDNVSEVLEHLTNMKVTVLSGQATHGAVGFLERILSTRALTPKPVIMTGSVSMEEVTKRFEPLGTLMTSQLLEAKCENHYLSARHQQKKRSIDIGWDQLGA